MPTNRRVAARTAVLVAVAALCWPAAARPARATGVFVQLNPSTVQAGYLIGVVASCRDDTRQATVRSPAFGTVPVRPQDDVLTAAALVPETTRAGTYPVRLDCPDGRDATTDLVVLAAGRPARGPATGFGGSADPGFGDLLLPAGVATTVAGALLGLVAVRRRRTYARAGR